MADVAPLEKSHTVRLSFEQRALFLIVLILGIACAACFLALYPTQWAREIGDRVNMMRDSISYFVGLLASTLGVSMARGHMDARIAAKDGDQ